MNDASLKPGRKDGAAQVTLTFPSQMGLVPAVRTFVRQVIRQKGYGERDCFRTETIVDEICNNAVQHGLQREGNSVTLRLAVDQDRVVIDAENESDPGMVGKLRSQIEAIQEKIVVDSNNTRGRGLALVKMLANELSAAITDTGTTVHVTKLKEGK